MKYATPTLKTVTGAVVALITFNTASDVTQFSEIVILGAMFFAGLVVVVHGVFTGIEAAVATGTDQPTPNAQQNN